MDRWDFLLAYCKDHWGGSHKLGLVKYINKNHISVQFRDGSSMLFRRPFGYEATDHWFKWNLYNIEMIENFATEQGGKWRRDIK